MNEMPPEHPCRFMGPFNGTNYKYWISKTEARLRHKGLWQYCIVDTTDSRSFYAAHFIRADIEPLILTRIPSQRISAYRLLAHLRAVAQPFRIMDLPTELRLQIFKTALDSELYHTPWPLLLGSSNQRAKAWKLPALTRVPNKKLRSEALELFISTTHLSLNLLNCMYVPSAERINRIVRDWAGNSAKAYQRHLRCLDFDIYPWHRCVLTFSGAKGLEIELVAKTDRTSFLRGTEKMRARLEEYIQTIEAERKVLNLKGEAIILAMIKDHWVWHWER